MPMRPCGSKYLSLVAVVARAQAIAGVSPADIGYVDHITPGHLLVVPRRHVADALEDPELTGRVMAGAAALAASRRLHPCNIMTSAGREATQSVFHLHLHIVPRAAGDGPVAVPGKIVTRPRGSGSRHSGPSAGMPTRPRTRACAGPRRR